MIHSDFFDHHQKKQNKEYFVHLASVAKSDNAVRQNELKLLHRIGKNLGFTDPEIDKLLETPGMSDYSPPYELSKRFDQVYEIIKMTLVDGVIDNSEMSLARSFAVKSGFTESEIPKLFDLLIIGIKHGKDEEDLFEVYKKERIF